MKRVWRFLMLIGLPVCAMAEDGLDARLARLAGQLRCLVCQNETLADSRADLAADLRREIRGQMKAGRSDGEILSFLTERYGDFILYRPPLAPRTVLLWWGPFLMGGLGLVALRRYVKGRSSMPDHRLSGEERARVAKLLRGEGRTS